MSRIITRLLLYMMPVLLLFNGCGSDSTTPAPPPPALKSVMADGVMQGRRLGYLTVSLKDGRVLVAGGYDTAVVSPLDSSAELYDPATGSFSQTANRMSSARHEAAAVRLNNGSVLITGGQDEENVALYSAELFNPVTNRFEPVTPMRIARTHHTATLLPDGRVLVAGGRTYEGIVLNSAEIFDPKTGSFTLLKMTHYRAEHAAAPLPDGRVLLAGGLGADGEATISCELFNPVNGMFIQTDDLPETRLWPTATPLPDGRVLLAGGGIFDSSTFATRDTAVLYDPGIERFTPVLTSMSTGRISHAAVLLPNGKVLIAGGFFYNNRQQTHITAELYDPTTKSFTPTGSLNLARGCIEGALLPDGRVLIAGGRDKITYARASAELYDPVVGAFSVTGGLNSERVLDASLLLPDGSVLITGGLDTTGVAQMSAERYLPSTGRFVATSGAMNSGRYGHTAVPLQNGTVLTAGGSSDAAAELYDAASDRFLPAGSLQTARRHHTATRLLDGSVLIAGGEEPDVDATDTAELYLPASDAFVNVGNLTVPRALHTAHLLSNGKVLLIGGTSSMINYTANALDTAELYDPATRTFSPLAARMSAARISHASQSMRDGGLLISGGINADGLQTAVELFDPITLTFRKIADLPVPLYRHRMVLLADGRLVIIGGTTYYTTPFVQTYTSSDRTFLYDARTIGFADGPTLKTERDNCLAVGLINGSILVGGGGFAPRGNRRVVLETAELLVP